MAFKVPKSFSKLKSCYPFHLPPFLPWQCLVVPEYSMSLIHGQVISLPSTWASLLCLVPFFKTHLQCSSVKHSPSRTSHSLL